MKSITFIEAFTSGILVHCSGITSGLARAGCFCAHTPITIPSSNFSLMNQKRFYAYRKASILSNYRINSF